VEAKTVKDAEMEIIIEEESNKKWEISAYSNIKEALLVVGIQTNQEINNVDIKAGINNSSNSRDNKITMVVKWTTKVVLWVGAEVEWCAGMLIGAVLTIILAQIQEEINNKDTTKMMVQSKTDNSSSNSEVGITKMEEISNNSNKDKGEP